MKDKLAHLLLIVCSLVGFSIMLSSCGSFSPLMKRNYHVYKVVSQLELGMYKEEVLTRLSYKPDYTSKYLLDNQVNREVYTYRSLQQRSWILSDIPFLHHLIFDDGVLVSIETEENLSEARRGPFISTQVGVVFHP